jgi:hypothetical protein
MLVADLLIACFSLTGATFFLTHSTVDTCGTDRLCLCKGDKVQPYCIRNDVTACNQLAVGMRVSSYLTYPSGVVQMVAGQLESLPLALSAFFM